MGAARIPRSVVWPGLMAVAGGCHVCGGGGVGGGVGDHSSPACRRRGCGGGTYNVSDDPMRSRWMSGWRSLCGIGVGESDGVIAGRLGRSPFDGVA